MVMCRRRYSPFVLRHFVVNVLTYKIFSCLMFNWKVALFLSLTASIYLYSECSSCSSNCHACSSSDYSCFDFISAIARVVLKCSDKMIPPTCAMFSRPGKL